MECEANQCNKTSAKYNIFIMITSLERWQPKAKEAHSPCEVRLTPLDTNTVFKCLRERVFKLVKLLATVS